MNNLQKAVGYLRECWFCLIELHDGYTHDQFAQDVAPAGLLAYSHGVASASARRT